MILCVGFLLLEEAFQKFSENYQKIRLMEITICQVLADSYIVLLVQNDCGFQFQYCNSITMFNIQAVKRFKTVVAVMSLHQCTHGICILNTTMYFFE